MARRKAETPVEPAPASRAQSTWESVRAIVWAVLLALAIRSFLVEPFKIPSGSMIPTLLVGDYVLVNKFSYGVRLPITGTLVIPMDKPQRGDVIVFRYPDDASQDFIKRIVGMPGDRVEMRDNRLWVNGQIVDLIADGSLAGADAFQRGDLGRYIERNPEGNEYSVLYAQRSGLVPLPRGNEGPWLVPDGQYFTMGDNRDNSQDSRRWTHSFVHADQIKGRAFRIHWSWVIDPGSADRNFVVDLLHTLWQVVTFQIEEVRWSRIGRSLDGLAAGAGEAAGRPVSD